MWYIKIHYKKLLNQDENLRAYWDIKYSGLRYLIYAKLKVQENFYQDKVSNNE